MSLRRSRVRRVISTLVVVGMSTSFAATVAAEHPAGAATTTMPITGAPPWTSTGVTLTAGQSVSITASGTIYNGNASTANNGNEPPDGAACGLSGFTLDTETAPCWSLIGMIGDNEFFVGSSSQFNAPTDGVLYLAMNDNNYGDNSGSWSVTITTGSTLSITDGVNPPAVHAAGPVPVSFTVPTASDGDGSVPVACDHASGSVFPLGWTTVTCSADKAGDNPPHVETTLTVAVYSTATLPSAPQNVNVTPGVHSGLVSFDRPVNEGSDPVSRFNVSCTSSNGGTSGSAAGPSSPINVTGLRDGSTYTCTVTASNSVGTGPPSAPSNMFAPLVEDVCTNQTTCHALISAPASPQIPLQTSAVSGIPSDLVGRVSLSIASGLLSCPSVTPAPAPITSLDNSGFDAGTTLTVTMTLFYTAATAQEQVCFDSIRPFRSQSSPTVAVDGPGLLLMCSDVGNVAPCVLSSARSGNNIVVKFIVPGGDPRFYLVLPKGRQVWLSRFPPGKVGARYTAQLQSSGGKAPIHWKVVSGKLPPGLTLNASTGAITGTPKAKGNFTVTAKATDSESPPKVAQMSVPITIK